MGSKRAVRLTPQGRELLETALNARWAQEFKDKKQTREARADFFQLSIATTHKILAGKPVDKSSIQLAFQRLDLLFQDSLVHKDNPATSEQKCPPKRSNFRWFILGGAIGLSVLALLVHRSMKSGSHNPIIETWRFELNRLIHEGTDRYQKGDYKTSEKKLRAALEISLRQDLGGATAETIRMLGDIAAAKGELQVARSRYFDALEIRRKGLKMNSGEIRVKIENSIPPLLEALGVIETRLHLWKEAKNHLLEAKQKYLEQQVNSGVAMAYRGLGTIAYETGDHNDALLCFTKALGSLEEKDRFSDLAWDIRARRAVLLGEVVDAAAAYQVLKECLSHWQARRHVRWQAETEMQLGKVALLRSCRRDAQRHFERALKQFTEVGDAENARIAKVAIAKVAKTAQS